MHKMQQNTENECSHGLELQTNLSSNVHHLVCTVGSQTSSFVHGVIMSEGLIDWKSLHELLFGLYEGSWKTEKNFEELVARLAPFAQAVHDEIMDGDREAIKENLKGLLLWTSDSETLVQCLECFFCSEDTVLTQASVETCLLLTTSILERSLGNIFLLKNSCCPSLLKDLLITEELENVFGSTALFCLRILMGPPTSLNLRNLLWHGFVKPGEIPERYGIFLLVLVASLGKLLRDQRLEASLHAFREFTDVSPQVYLLESKFPDLKVLPKDVYSFQYELTMIPANKVWIQGLEYFMQKRYSWSAVLLTPLLECILRQLFARANDCPERVLTAESSTLFTTFDEILACQLPDGSENKVRHVIGDSFLEMLLDLLVYPDGPRFRDRLSHGELSLCSVGPSLVLLVICIIVALSDKVSGEEKFRKTSFYSKSSLLFGSYQSLFHPIPMLMDDYLRFCTTLDSWVDLPRPTNEELVTNGFTSDGSGQMHDDVKRLFFDRPLESLAGYIVRFADPFSDTGSHVTSCKELKIETIFRAKAELQLVTALHQIVAQCAKVDENIQTISRTRFNQWENRKLRSRQRVNYTKFIESIPQLSVGVRIVAVVTYVYMRNVNRWEHCTSTAAHHK